MKKIILTFLLGILTLNIYPQAIVADPVSHTINTAMKVLQEGSQRLQKFTAEMEVLKLDPTALDQLNSVKQIMDLTDQLLCLTTELRLNMDVKQNYSCATFLNYKMVTFNLSYSTDILNKVLLSKNLFTMQSSERLTVLENIRRTLEKTIYEMQAMNDAFNNINKKIQINQHVQKNYYSPNTHSFSRYNK